MKTRNSAKGLHELARTLQEAGRGLQEWGAATRHALQATPPPNHLEGFAPAGNIAEDHGTPSPFLLCYALVTEVPPHHKDRETLFKQCVICRDLDDTRVATMAEF